MLIDDLIASLHAHAGEAGQPAEDLLAKVERHAQRQQRSRIAAYAGTAAIALLLAAVGLGAAVRSPGHPGTLSPASGDGTRATAPMENLTGSMCDSAGAARPVDYLDWPCVAPVGQTALIVEERLAVEIGRDFGSITHPLVRLIATDHVHNGYALAEWWDADHPETPTQVIELDGPGTSYGAAPVDDPDLIRGQQSLFTRDGITSVTLEPRGTTLAFNGGVAAVPDLGNVKLENASTLVARDAAGHTKPSWSFPLGGENQSPPDSLCATHAGVGTCSPNSNYTLSSQPPLSTGDCTTPQRVPVNYLSWPCAREVDVTTPARVAAAVTAVVATHIGVAEPRARLLADSRDAGYATGHQTASLVEVWDAAGTGPAVVVVVSGAAGSDRVRVRIDNDTPPGDPAGVAESDGDTAAATDGSYPEVSFVFVRRDVVTVHLRTDHASPTSQTSPPIGGVTSFPIPNITGTKTLADGVLSGETATGETVFTTEQTGNSGLIPCGGNTGVTGSTCVPQFPSDLPAPTTTAGIPTS